MSTSVISCQKPTVKTLPLVLDSPHSGRIYPEDFAPAVSLNLLRRAADAYVDELYQTAPQHGATLICALFPRSYIDVNRDETDLDPTLIDGPWPHPTNPGAKSALGLGLIWKTIRDGHGSTLPLYQRLLTVSEVEHRLVHYYRQYHTTLQKFLDTYHAEFKQVWHINCHSMPARGDVMSPDPGQERADFVLGDRLGTSSSGEFTELITQSLRKMGYQVALNNPFQGAELVTRYSNPTKGRHSLQIEINRRLYLDEDTLEKLPTFIELQQNLDKLLSHATDYIRDKLSV